VVGAVVLALVAAIVFGFFHMAAPRTPSGVKYEPGVPPWLTKDASGRLVPKAGAAPQGPPPAQPSVR
jgi:hypothetical protein